jgi:hypothetical protein
MRFSVHNKLRGGFDYYDAPDTVPVNDDHPAPRLARHRTKLGIPATRAGRPLPSGAHASGNGELPVGSISSGKAGSWGGGGGLPSGLGLGLGSVDLPCPSQKEATIAGATLATILFLGLGQSGTVRGLAMIAAGGALGYMFWDRACFWR